MSKLQDRVPALVTREDRLQMTTSVIEDVEQDGRIEKADLLEAVQNRLAELDVNETILVDEGRKAAANQLVSAWSNYATIKLDRTQRTPVYQTTIGFRDSWFKVGSTFVAPEAMTSQDFEVMLERVDRRIENAQTDRSILADFYARAKPGLDAGQNLVEQFDAGMLELVAVDGAEPEALEAGEDEA